MDRRKWSSRAVVDAARLELDRKVAGEVLSAGDAWYESARCVFNAMIDRRPALILRCANRSDVQRGIEFARTHDMALAVRSGGHGVAGNAVCDGGLVLDMGAMKAMNVDLTRRIADVESGVTLGEFDRATQLAGLATTTGVVSVTGLVGLTLGGGLGWLNSKHGLACDNVDAAEIVTADSGVAVIGSDENPDLFWAIRGGGGNFGVVTSLRYRLHSVGTVLGGGVSFQAAHARDALRFFDEFASTSPDELSMAGSVSLGVDGEPVVSVGVCYCGPIAEGERVLALLRAFGPPALDAIGPMGYVDLQSANDAGFPAGRRHYWKSSYLRRLSDDAIEVMLRFVRDTPSPFTGVGLQQLGGAAARVDASATAFPHRDRQYDLLILSQWERPEDDDRNITWTRSFFEAMTPFLEAGVYVNNLGDEGNDRVRAAYGSNYERLARVKSRYDPDNIFRLNHNVAPANC